MRMYLIVLLLPFFFLGCSVEKVASNYIIDNLQRAETRLASSENHYLVEKAMPGLLVMVDNAVATSPLNVELLLRAAKMHTLYAFSFAEPVEPKWAELHYRQAREYSLRALELSYSIAPQEIMQAQEREKIATLPKESVPALFWLAMSWGGLVQVNKDQIQFLGDLPYIEFLATHALSLDENYEDGFIYLLLGSVYSGSGDDKARQYFDKALHITKRQFFMAQLLYAKNFAVTSGDRALFGKLLEEVFDGWKNRDSKPFARRFTLANAVAYRRAQELMDDIDDIFFEE